MSYTMYAEVQIYRYEINQFRSDIITTKIVIDHVKKHNIRTQTDTIIIQ